MEYINLTPNYEVTTQFFAETLAQQGFEKNAKEPVISLIEQVRYLALTDPEALKRVLVKLGGKG